MNKGINDKVNPNGVVLKRLFSREKYYNILKQNGVEFGLSWDHYTLTEMFIAATTQLGKINAQKLLDKSAKPMFKTNALWRLLKMKFGKDIVIPLITGFYTLAPIKANLVTNAGHAIVAGQLNGVTSTAVTAIAIGTGTTAAAAGDTALQTEITTGGGARGAATTSRVTTSVTNDTAQWVKTFNFTSSFAVTEEGLLDNNASGGNLLAHQVFSAVNVVNGDSLQITHKVQC